MNVFPSVVLLSQDQLLEELLEQLLRCEGFLFQGATSVPRVVEVCGRPEGAPGVVLIDAIEGPDQARTLLEGWAEVGSAPPTALILLAGSTTPGELVRHPALETVIHVPLSAEGLVAVLRHHAQGLSRVRRRSDIEMTPAEKLLAPAT